SASVQLAATVDGQPRQALSERGKQGAAVGYPATGRELVQISGRRVGDIKIPARIECHPPRARASAEVDGAIGEVLRHESGRVWRRDKSRRGDFGIRASSLRSAAEGDHARLWKGNIAVGHVDRRVGNRLVVGIHRGELDLAVSGGDGWNWSANHRIAAGLNNLDEFSGRRPAQ